MDIVLLIIHFVGIASFAAAGAMVAIDHETDLFGVIFLSVITCFGGGLLRDVIAGQVIGRDLPVLFTDMNMEIVVSILTALVVFILASVFKRQYVKEEEVVNKINNVLDALAIGIFSASGTGDYLVAGPLVAITMGMISSVGGSLTRDVILRDIPFILRKRIYALACLAGSGVYYLLVAVILKNMDGETASLIATIACVVVIFTIRMCATAFKWNMPKAIRFSVLRDAEKQEDGNKKTLETK